jgi:hypothetical protein
LSDNKSIFRTLFSVTLLGLTVLGAINVFGDNSEVVKMAETVACGTPGCAVQQTRGARNPIGQEFSFQTETSAQSRGGIVDVSCRRSLFLVGEYSCEKTSE